uniref:succinate dehydrogenase subunit 4 n=1 Tax=Stewartia sinensis TaxID=182325 RepID=UPI00286C1531|nr:succinate dehydrogenase subunit 4 [Stewartia sinensis]WJZ51447.1 succinate dehydrogenase subunit 4 [Stewartia sinensis var. sinensis]
MVLAFCRRGSVIPICLYLLVGRYMKERISGLRNESSKTKRTGLFQRITAAFPLPLIIIYKKVSSTFLPNLSVFWHINEGIEEIMADHVHQEMTRNWILVYLRLFLLIVIKDVFLSLVSFLNKSKNPMDRTLTPGDLTADPPATKWLDPPTTGNRVSLKKRKCKNLPIQ